MRELAGCMMQTPTSLREARVYGSVRVSSLRVYHRTKRVEQIC